MRCVVGCFWGPRPESLEALADRWARTLESLEAQLAPMRHSGGEFEWRRVHSDGPPTPVEPGEGILAELRASRAEQDWSDIIGTGLRLVSVDPAGRSVEVSGIGGGRPEYLLQSLVVTVHGPNEPPVSEQALLATLVDIWEPDFADVTDDDVLDALEDEAGHIVGDPVIGRLGYLSARRAAVVPAGLGIARTGHPRGGTVLHLADPGEAPSAVAAYRRLREAGALAPLPRPMDRAVW
ncbi:hypothetical protein G4H71_21470 [Rhodococcus triatomae]|uniref:Immunity protein 52 domain-containing protein n=1 Tax=Rhodococcus triatomae TaxID=300028 RepID=A0A1G8K3H9_9NOCA|nr:hypothetical protein [Rhodococcus triatomae]QNG18816.1 hypothetical protein G4H72_08905 [Rhodococcus triatomae]QNG25273.1 hypothetical protein G4H71_21470 [Rhodococcus triatomae]SDI38002.1 hypothetical protein SAMN05444695_10713 [Rhodococcus triatomae]